MCLLEEEYAAIKAQSQANQQNIKLNNPCRISPTSDEETSHTHSSKDDSSSSDEFQ